MGDALKGGEPALALLLADASPGAGLGHLARCTALAEALRERGFEVATGGLGAAATVELDGVHWEPWQGDAGANGPAPAVLVLDTYDRDAWRRLAELPHGRLVTFEDARPVAASADVTIASEEGAEAPGRVLGGLRFACLRRPYWEVGPRAIADPPRSLLVSSGGSDLGGLAGRVAACLRDRFAAPIRIELVWAPGFAGEPPPGVTAIDRPSSLLEPLLGADAAVCTGGQTLLEAAAAGTPTLALEGALNQRPQIAALAARGAVLPVEEDGVAEAMESLLGSPSRRRDLSRRAQRAVDGRGALRVAAELASLSWP